MTQGSSKREAQTDQQCKHCGRFYSPQGIANHEAHCRYKNRDDRLVPEEDRTSASPTPDTESTDSKEGGTSGAATDGGSGLGLEGPPEPSTAVDDQGDVVCPNCETVHDDENPDRLDAHKTYECDQCGHSAEGSAWT